jgi:hypothetical protein
MKKILFVLPFIVGFIIGYCGLRFYDQKGTINGKVLSEKTEIEGGKIPTLTPAPTLAPTNTPTPSPLPTPTLIPTPTPIPQPAVSSKQIHGFIERFANQYGVNPNVLRHLATCESGFNPSATNLSYAGLFQFTDFTWKKYRLQMGEEKNSDLRFNAEEAVQTAAYVLSLNHTFIWPSCAP